MFVCRSCPADGKRRKDQGLIDQEFRGQAALLENDLIL